MIYLFLKGVQSINTQFPRKNLSTSGAWVTTAVTVPEITGGTTAGFSAMAGKKSPGFFDGKKLRGDFWKKKS